MLLHLLVVSNGRNCKLPKSATPAAGAFATLLVQLPSTFEGGSLVFRSPSDAGVEPRSEKQQRWDMAEGSEYSLQYAAFHQDCEHALEPVTSGHRVLLVYSLCTPPVRSLTLYAP